MSTIKRSSGVTVSFGSRKSPNEIGEGVVSGLVPDLRGGCFIGNSILADHFATGETDCDNNERTMEPIPEHSQSVPFTMKKIAN